MEGTPLKEAGLVGVAVPVVVVVGTATSSIALALQVVREAAKESATIEGKGSLVGSAAVADVFGADVGATADSVKPLVVSRVGYTRGARSWNCRRHARWGPSAKSSKWARLGARGGSAGSQAQWEVCDPVVHAVGRQLNNAQRLKIEGDGTAPLSQKPLEHVNLNVPLEQDGQAGLKIRH